jgi:hypothetical protein
MRLGHELEAKNLYAPNGIGARPDRDDGRSGSAAIITITITFDGDA